MYLVVDGLKVPQADIKQLSSQWRGVLETMDYASSGAALRILSAIVKSYLRGRGCRMGNISGLIHHYNKAATLTTTVTDITPISSSRGALFISRCRATDM